MYRIPHLTSVSSALTRSQVGTLHSVGRFQTINTSTKDVKPKSRFLFYSIGTLLTGVLGTAGLVVYSKNDPKFHELLITNVPGVDKFLKVFDEEDLLKTSKELGGRIACKVGQQVKSLKEKFIGQSNDVFDRSIEKIKSVSHKIPTSIPNILKGEEKNSLIVEESVNQAKKLSQKIEPVKSKIESKTHQVEPEEQKPAITILPPKQYSLDELESEILNYSSLGMEAYNLATQSLKEYSDSIYKLIENSTEKIDPNLNDKLQKLEAKKNQVYTKAYQDAKKYKQELIKKQKLLNDPKFESTPDKLAKALHRTNDILQELSKANLTLESEVHRSELMNKYQSKVNKGQMSLIEEFESLFPNSDITQTKTNELNADYDLFLMYAMKKLNQYQDQLAKIDALHDRKLKNAMNSELFDVEAANRVNSRISSEIHNLEKQFESQLNEINVKVDENMQNQLKLYTQAHADLVVEAVESTKEEIELRVRQELSAIEQIERKRYQEQLDKLRTDLQNVVDNLKERAEKEKKVFTSQTIWEACEKLKLSLSTSDNDKPVDITNHINSIKKAGASDPIVKQVINIVPSKAFENGVISKGQLKEDFNQVEKRVYQTALIPDSTFNLPLMAFSFLISFFIVRHSHVSTAEVNNDEFDPSELNTYEIIERARYCVDRDDFMQALRYLNLLTGCSYVVAKSWMKEATVFLETKQAIDLLTTYATV
ncbi:MICOS complex subunit Mic60-like [Adelges cooleyi]|uniref:MICOS complex subunit Mic60-like n=1 Tax=Adelges cooleyi TaxID=133065 RepID=UPI00217F6D5F|nr:MICOS complex subunit Mic60-like [Adelges cooleyi]